MKIADAQRKAEDRMREAQVELMALDAFRKTGRFILAIPGYQRIEYMPRDESQAAQDAQFAASYAVNAPRAPAYKIWFVEDHLVARPITPEEFWNVP